MSTFTDATLDGSNQTAVTRVCSFTNVNTCTALRVHITILHPRNLPMTEYTVTTHHIGSICSQIRWH